VIGEGWLLKVAVIPGVVLLATDVLPKILNAGVQAVIITAAVIGGIGVLGKAGRRGWRNGRDFIRHARRGLHVIDTVPGRLDTIESKQDKMDTRLEAGDKRFEMIESHIDVIAQAQHLRVDDAIAGDDRKPAVDRRERAA
jgi:hypothetical protein